MLQLSEEDSEIHVIDNEESLEAYRSILEEAYVCALDAEWQPNACKPSATLVQLAFRTKQSKTLILLLDLLKLPKDCVGTFLQYLFRGKHILKVGYGLANDMLAIGTALGSQGSSVVACASPVLETRILSSQLRRSAKDVIPKAAGPGLGGLIQGIFKQTLDKRLQCSPWGERPLTKAQLHYAALDAACLLGLLEAYIRLVPPGKPFSSKSAEIQSQNTTDCLDSDAPASHEGSATSSTARTDTHANGALPDQSRNGGLTDGEAAFVVPSLPGTGHAQETSIKCQNASSPDPGREGPVTAQDCSAAGALVAELDRLHIEDSLSLEGRHLTEEAVRAASELWSCRLDISAGQGRLTLQNGQILDLASHVRDEEKAIIGFPAYLPWEQNGGPAKFIADHPQEGLARQLRMFGFDAKSSPNLTKTERHKVFRLLADSAKDEGRVILTCDRLFIQRRMSNMAYFVQAANKKQQFDEVVQAFNLKIATTDLMSRCGKCNGNFIPRPFEYLELPAESKHQTIPVKIVEDRDTSFWVCNTCKHVYWR